MVIDFLRSVCKETLNRRSCHQWRANVPLRNSPLKKRFRRTFLSKGMSLDKTKSADRKIRLYKSPYNQFCFRFLYPLRLNRPNGDDKRIAVKRGETFFQTNDGAHSYGERGFFQHVERGSHGKIGTCSLFDFQGVQQSVRFNNQIDFLCILVAVIMQIALFACVQIGLADFGNDIVFKDCAVDCAVK